MIKRIQVEEGFLNGLDLTFSRGLNVLIGPRGSGKTSIIELIRFCLGVPGYTDRSQAAEREHALSVLGSGQVTVTLQIDDRDVVVTRTAAEESPRASGTFPLPNVLSQNEIELVGLQVSGRLRLIDGFIPGQGETSSQEGLLLAQIRSLTSELQTVTQEVTEIEGQLIQLEPVLEQLDAAQKTEATLAASVAATETSQTKLRELGAAVATASVKNETLKRAIQALRQFKEKAQALLSPTPLLAPWPSSAGPTDLLSEARTIIAGAVQGFRDAVDAIDRAIQQTQHLESLNTEQRLKLEEEARLLRQQLEKIQHGAGAISRQVSELREKASQLSALRELRASREDDAKRIRDKRGELLDALDVLRESRYQRRLDAAARLTTLLAPAIEISIVRAAFHADYVRAITTALRGSGLHYSTLAPALADSLSPRELVEAVEGGDVGMLLNVAGLNTERATRTLSQLRSQSLGDILTAQIQDAVELKLLVGTEYRSTEQLSTGQRCTVVLPILLAGRDDALIVDQPEDHLDNAFIANTVIQAIRVRKESGQMIFATHNPNLPVLGDAELVVSLGSDGRRGFVSHAGLLDAPKSVEAITSVMEGGREAFARRAAFYRQHGR